MINQKGQRDSGGLFCSGRTTKAAGFQAEGQNKKERHAVERLFD